MTHQRSDGMTYAPKGEGFVLINAYAHRMSIMEGEVPSA